MFSVSVYRLNLQIFNAQLRIYLRCHQQSNHLHPHPHTYQSSPSLLLFPLFVYHSSPSIHRQPSPFNRIPSKHYRHVVPIYCFIKSDELKNRKGMDVTCDKFEFYFFDVGQSILYLVSTERSTKKLSIAQTQIANINIHTRTRNHKQERGMRHRQTTTETHTDVLIEIYLGRRKRKTWTTTTTNRREYNNG